MAVESHGEELVPKLCLRMKTNMKQTRNINNDRPLICCLPLALLAKKPIRSFQQQFCSLRVLWLIESLIQLGLTITSRIVDWLEPTTGLFRAINW